MSVASLNRVVIDLAALRHNYRCLQERVGSLVRVMAVVKSDAYGHGLLPAARAFREAGARTFGVAEVEEGVALREAGIDGEIIVLLGTLADGLAAVIDHDLQPVVYDLDLLAALSDQAQRKGKRARVHLKVDTGMGRLGIMPDEAGAYLAAIERLPGVVLAGVVSHFPMADAPLADGTRQQLVRFESILQRLRASSAARQVVHIANSAALIRYPEAHFDMVRPGIALYGCYPAADEKYRQSLALEPAMSFKTRVVQVKQVPAGYGISYGHRYVTDRPTRLAVLPVGYDDGYLRRLANRAEVLIRGRRAPVRGMVCMNACMADVTEVPGVRAGDEVVLMGRQGSDEIDADEMAAWLETISYEVLCLFGGRNRHMYVER